ncbi:MAG: hypothetical protein ACYSTI_10870 [Planctomycetota bacterium]
MKHKQDLHSIRPKDDPRPHIPAGEYEAECIKAEKKPYLGGEKRLYVHFRITYGEHQGITLFAVYNFNYTSFSERTKYYTDWSVANEGRPAKKDSMSPDVFLHKIFLVKVRDVIPKYDDGIPKPEMFVYSVVDKIIEKSAG